MHSGGQSTSESSADASVRGTLKRGSLGIVLAISCLNLMSYTAVSPITPGLMKRFTLASGAGESVGVGLVASSFALGRFCTTSLWPIASDFKGRKPVLCIALLGGALGSLLQGLAISLGWPFGMFLLVRGLAGMFSGIVPVIKAYIVDNFDPEEVPKILAYREAAGTLAFVIGPAIGGVLASRVFSSPLYFSALTGIVATLLTANSLQESSLEERAARREAAKEAKLRRAQDRGSPEATSRPLAVALLLFSFSWACTRTCFHAFYPLMLNRRYQFPIAELGYVLTTVSLLVAAVQVTGFEPCRKRIKLKGTLALGAGLVWMGLVALGGAPERTPLAVFLLFSSIYAVGCALLSPALPAMLVRAAPAGRAGALLGIESAIVNFGRIVAPPIFGLVYRKTEGAAVRVIASISVVLLALLLLPLSWRRPDAPRVSPK